jgi:hypothetical protein
MPNALYDAGRENVLKGDIAWLSDNIRIAFIDEADDTIDLAADADMGDRVSGSIVATSGNLASKTATGGVADAADIQVLTVSGDQFESIDIFKYSGLGAASDLLIANIDTAVGLPYTPSGGDIVVQWDSGANKIFKL